MTSHWIRGSNLAVGTPWSGQSYLLAQLPNGATLRRMHFGIDITAWITVNALDTQITLDQAISNGLDAGIVTVIGNGFEVVPFAVPPLADPAWPTQRWIWWASLFPRFNNWAPVAGQTYGFSATEQFDHNEDHAQVKAVGVGAGQFLDVWLTVAGQIGPWTTVGGTDTAHIRFWWSLLYTV